MSFRCPGRHENDTYFPFLLKNNNHTGKNPDTAIYTLTVAKIELSAVCKLCTKKKKKGKFWTCKSVRGSEGDLPVIAALLLHIYIELFTLLRFQGFKQH